MAFDLDGFLKEMGATAEEETLLRGALGKPERLAALEKGYLRQSDYSKSMNALTKAQTDLEGMKVRLDAEAAEWATLSAGEKANATKLREDLEAHQAKVLTLTQRVQRIAADAGLDPVKALEGIDQPPAKREEPVAPVDMSKFAAADAMGQLGNYLFTLATELPTIADEHFALTGQRLDTRALGAEITKRAAVKGAVIDPRKVWEETHNIPTVRDTKAKEAREAEMKAAEQRGWERARSEGAVPTAPSVGVHSPVLRANGEQHKSVLNRPAPEGGVQSAAAALATGKYRPQPPGQR